MAVQPRRCGRWGTPFLRRRATWRHLFRGRPTGCPAWPCSAGRVHGPWSREQMTWPTTRRGRRKRLLPTTGRNLNKVLREVGDTINDANASSQPQAGTQTSRGKRWGTPSPQRRAPLLFRCGAARDGGCHRRGTKPHGRLAKLCGRWGTPSPQRQATSNNGADDTDDANDSSKPQGGRRRPDGVPDAIAAAPSPMAARPGRCGRWGKPSPQRRAQW